MWPASRHYAVDPMSGAAASLILRRRAGIIGVSLHVVGVVTPRNIDSRSWPAQLLRLQNAYGLARARSKLDVHKT